MAYDAARQRLTLFGQADPRGDVLFVQSGTWTLDGNQWRQHSPRQAPSPRNGQAMAYDPLTQATLLYGGFDIGAGTLLSDLWRWNGFEWSRVRVSGPQPPALKSAAMAYDFVNNQMILFGGSSANGPTDQTWALQRDRWTRLSPSAKPSPRSRHAMSSDPVRQRIVLVGGLGAGAQTDVWEWNGTTWSLAPALPDPRFDMSLSYDLARNRTVLVGGGPYTLAHSAILEFDGSNWLPTTSPRDAMRAGPAAAYDPAKRSIVVFGGRPTGNSKIQTRWGDTNTWDGRSWNAIDARPRATGFAQGFDPRRGVLVQFGGTRITAPFHRSHAVGETWEWDGKVWRQRRTPVAPPAGLRGSMVFDSRRNRMMLIGDLLFPRTGTQLWEYDGANWTRVRSATTPPSLPFHAAAFDANRGRVLLAGQEPNRSLSMWEWDGLDWQKVGANSFPASNFIYEPSRQRIVGFDNKLGSLAEWIGSRWQPFGPRLPLFHTRVSVRYNASTKRLAILFDRKNARLHYELDASSGWQAIAGTRDAVNALPTFDPWRKRFTARYGDDFLIYGARGRAEKLGASCSAALIGPTLRAALPRQGFTTRLELHRGPASQIAALGLAATTGVRYLGHCPFYLDSNAVFLPSTTNAVGFAQTPRLDLPRLSGMKFYAQAVILNPRSTVLGMDFSSGLSVTVGD